MEQLSDNERKRNEIVAAVAQHLVRDGFQNSGIRALAKSAGLSDRMVMYYFETKEDLIAQALLTLAQGLTENLETVLPARRASATQLVEALAAAGQQPAIQPILRLWFEIVGLAMRGHGPYRATAALILSGWESWIRDKLGPKQAHLAPELLARIEGQLMITLLQAR